MRSMRSAIAFLTRIPTGFNGPLQRGTVAWFWIPGLLAGLVWYLSFQLFGPTALGAVCAIGGEAVLTGGLHWDGWVDTFDGWMAPKDRRTVARRDSRIGTGGALFLGLALLAFWTLWTNSGSLSPMILILPPLWARASMAWGVSWRYVDPSSGSLNALVEATDGGTASWVTLIMSLLIAVLAIGFEGVNVFGGTLLVVGLFMLWARKLFGGMNGDVLGASAILTEIVGLYFLVAVAAHPVF